MRKPQKNAREIIINVARNIFTRFGFKKTTMDEIAQAAHKGKSSIYHYFKSKEEIFQTVVQKESRLLREEIIKAVKKEISPQKKLRAYIITRMQILHRLVNFYSALKDDYFEHYSFIEKMRKKHLRDEVELIKGILSEGVENGTFIVKNLEITSIAIITALKGLENPWDKEYDVLKNKKNIDPLLEIIFSGIVRK